MQYKRNSHDDEHVSHEMNYGRQQPGKEQRKTRAQPGRSRSTSGAASFNGMHRRRNKRWAW